MAGGTTAAPSSRGSGLGVNLYVDGFNLFYGSLKRTPYRWLDLERLASELLPGRQINLIHYFTARVKADPRDPAAPARYATWFRKIEEKHLMPSLLPAAVVDASGRTITKPSGW